MKLNEKAFALSAGIVTAGTHLLGMFGPGMMMGGGMHGMYGAGLAGVVFGFVFGGIVGYAFAWVYNSISARA